MAAGVQATNDDATSCKRYAVDKGYWDDPFVKLFCRSPDRKSPEISRGYYARVKAVENYCHQFLDLCNKQGQDSQIVSLGAGFDTLYWKLHAAGQRPGKFVEMDFPAIVSRKVVTCQSKKILSDVIKEGGCTTSDSSGIYGKHYSIVGVDLRNIDDVGKKLADVGIQPDKPTMILTECVLVYMETSEARRILSWASGMFPTALFVNYEPVNVYDQFGKVMLENLRLRSCALLGASDCVSLDQQKIRFLDCGWDNAYALDMWSIYSRLPKHELQRIERLEFLDEVELLQQLLQHYSISWAVNDYMGIGLNDLKL
jgi:[phosphatase 2A protein]-leucine-carboxy methyltransferase